MAHNNYYLDLCVDTYVVCGDRVLIRMHEKYHNWGSVGGHIDAGQDAKKLLFAIVRTRLHIQCFAEVTPRWGNHVMRLWCAR